jgi:hypothetical protein
VAPISAAFNNINVSWPCESTHTHLQNYTNIIRRIFLLYNIRLNYINLSISERYANILQNSTFSEFQVSIHETRIHFRCYYFLRIFSCYKFFLFTNFQMSLRDITLPFFLLRNSIFTIIFSAFFWTLSYRSSFGLIFVFKNSIKIMFSIIF